MEARLTALENRLRQTERALVVERLARQTAEVAEQTVETWPAGVDAEEIGRLPMFSCDIDLSERKDSIPWSQWSLTVRGYFGKFDRTAAWMLQQVETSVGDPIITDNTVMTSVEKRFSAQAYCVLVLTCRSKALQVVQQVPRGFGFQAWRQLFKEFEPHPPVKSQEMCQALLSPTKSDESGQMVRQQGNELKVCEEKPGDKVSILQPGRQVAWDLLHQEATESLPASRMCEASGSTDLADLVPLGEKEDDESAGPKEHFGWWEADHNENERRNFSAGPEKKCDQHRTGQCAGVRKDPESSAKELSGESGTGVLSPAAEQDACLLHENDSDQSMYSCPSPASDRGGKDLKNLAGAVVAPGVV